MNETTFVDRAMEEQERLRAIVAQDALLRRRRVAAAWVGNEYRRLVLEYRSTPSGNEGMPWYNRLAIEYTLRQKWRLSPHTVITDQIDNVNEESRARADHEFDVIVQRYGLREATGGTP